LNLRWLPTDNTGNGHKHCGPRPKSIDWFEYSTAGDCKDGVCRVHAVNYDAADQKHHDRKPAFSVDYVARLIDVGPGHLGDLAVSYFDEDGGGYGVGTRRWLSGEGANADEDDTDECHDAFRSLEKLVRDKQLGDELKLRLVNPCAPRESSSKGQRARSWWQKVLGGDL